MLWYFKLGWLFFSYFLFIVWFLCSNMLKSMEPLISRYFSILHLRNGFSCAHWNFVVASLQILKEQWRKMQNNFQINSFSCERGGKILFTRFFFVAKRFFNSQLLSFCPKESVKGNVIKLGVIRPNVISESSFIFV